MQIMQKLKVTGFFNFTNENRGQSISFKVFVNFIKVVSISQTSSIKPDRLSVELRKGVSTYHII